MSNNFDETWLSTRINHQTPYKNCTKQINQNNLTEIKQGKNLISVFVVGISLGIHIGT